MRHRLYIFGTFAWVATGALVIAGIQWTPHVQGTPEHAPVEIAQKPTAPQVAGSDTTTPSASSSPAPTTPSPVVMSVNKTVSVAAASPASNPVTTLPSVSYMPVIPDHIPDPAPATANQPVCTTDPSPYYSLIANSTITVASGAQSTIETIATSDASNVLWTPTSPIIWGDGTTTDTTAPVALVVDYMPNSTIGTSFSYSVRAQPSASPGTYNVSWLVTDDVRGICYTVTIVVTVVDPVPVVPVIQT